MLNTACLKLFQKLFASVMLGLLLIPVQAHAVPAESSVTWQHWDKATFERARREDRFIILNLHASWCHWCHVMDATTYSDPDVLAAINKNFIPVLVDQDADPELSYRYERFGWPATIWFDGDGNEILIRRGYLPPDIFLELLQLVQDDPSALPNLSYTPQGDPDIVQLDAKEREQQERLYFDRYDEQYGGFGDFHRFIQADILEWALENARYGRSEYETVWRKTLTGALKLIDPEWGGMYQYSDELDWSSPHFEKIQNIQLAAIRVYVLAYLQTREERWLQAALEIHVWLEDYMMSEDGAFFTSQDADLDLETDGKQYFKLSSQQRLALGLPRIDKALYARENGWVIQSLIALASATGEDRFLQQASRATKWVINNRMLESGGFGHGAAAESQAYLADNLAMAEAFIMLYRSTGERIWIEHATRTGHYIGEHYTDEKSGFYSRPPEADAFGAFVIPVKQVDENVSVTRLFNLLWRYTGDDYFRKLNQHGLAHLMAYVKFDVFMPGLLLAEREARFEPAHITVVGGKNDPAAKELFKSANQYPTRYLRIDWWDRQEGPLPNPDVTYPRLNRAAAFACANGVCSLPVFSSDDIAQAVQLVEPDHSNQF